MRDYASACLRLSEEHVRLADHVERVLAPPDQLQSEVAEDLHTLVLWCRAAAAFQPDGSRQPATRCEEIQGQLTTLVEQSNHTTFLDLRVETVARRMRLLVTEKIEELVAAHAARLEANAESGCATPPMGGGAGLAGMSIEDYEIIKPISRGAFGRVYLARKKATGDLFAIKVMRKADLIRKNMVQSVKNERNILAMANNPFVVGCGFLRVHCAKAMYDGMHINLQHSAQVRFYYSFTSRNNLYIVMEYLNGGDCYSLLRNLGAVGEDTARQYVAETVLALEYCHTQVEVLVVVVVEVPLRWSLR